MKIERLIKLLNKEVQEAGVKPILERIKNITKADPELVLQKILKYYNMLQKVYS